MFKKSILSICTIAVLGGCAATENLTKTSGAIVGGIAGAAIGIATGDDTKSRTRNAAIGAALGGALGFGAGAWAEAQREELAALAAESEALTLLPPDPELTPEEVAAAPVTVSLDGSVVFASGSASVSPEGRRTVADFAAIVAKYPDSTLEVVGHTDDRGDEVENEMLSAERAAAVSAELAKRGVDSARLKAYGKGESAPIADNGTDAGRAANRRVEIVITPVEGA